VSGEQGITNLGPIPEGMDFATATANARHLRKYHIDPDKPLTRLTICDTLRALWNALDALPDGEVRQQARDYIAAAYDYGKRMDARMKELKTLA
jgi:glycine/D-amino acid oxidase-like deaminating enzyme